jgi:hypothetical protein
MSLIQDVHVICTRLAPHGWAGLFNAHGLNITLADPEDLARELAKPLPDIRRGIRGFEDFAEEGQQGIDPDHPARSLLYHAFASPNVTVDADGNDLTDFPTLAELDTVENYVFGVAPPTLEELRRRAVDPGAPPGAPPVLAVVVFAYEYRPADQTCHKKHADLVFSRTGVARVGTHPPLYITRNRGFLPLVDGEPFGIRVLPARYAAYIAVRRKGSKALFCPLSFHEVGSQGSGDADNLGDAGRNFWMPLHKLFPGPDCLSGLPEALRIELRSFHLNEKLRRIHLELGKPATSGGPPKDTGLDGRSLDEPPFRFEAGIAELSGDPELGSGTLVPVPHPLVELARDREGRPVTFLVPRNPRHLSSSLMITGKRNGARPAPEFVNVRQRVNADGSVTDLNTLPDLEKVVERGGYRALHFIDHTADGWVEAACPQIDDPALDLQGKHAAYSLVTAPDFFPTCDQREMTEWAATLPSSLRDSVWQVSPVNLSEQRLPANLQLPGGRFDPADTTMAAIVPLLRKAPGGQTRPRSVDSLRHSPLPDDSAGVFDPGWDVARDVTNNALHMAAYGLGSPFPEDAKLCAALSTFWPAVAPDTTRTLEPRPDQWPPITVSPLTDEENGQAGNLPWDGTQGPSVITVGDRQFAEYPSFAYVDYVQSALLGKFSLALTSHVDAEQYQDRVLSMALVYQGLRRRPEDWLVLSFRTTTPGETELMKAQEEARATLSGRVYRFEVFARSNSIASPAGPQKRRVEIADRRILFADPRNQRVLMRVDEPNGRWKKVIG